MISVPSNTSIYLHVAPVDFRNGISGLGRICKTQLKKQPMSGAIFGFINKRKVSLKILYYDGSGFWLLHKRLSSGKVQGWPSYCGKIKELEARELQLLIMGANLDKAEFSNDWKKLLK